MNRRETLQLSPVRTARGEVNLPGSKSISNRVLLLAALSQGTTHIRGLLDSDDTRVMLTALAQLGVHVSRLGGDAVEITGTGAFTARQADLFLGNAGTAFRPLTAALAFSGGSYRLSGVARMHERPIGDLVDALRALGAAVHYLGEPGYPPLQIEPATVGGQRVRIKGSVSSQFLTALLMAAPLVTAAGGKALVIEVDGLLISQPYIEITLNMMARFGVKVHREVQADGSPAFRIDSDARYVSPGQIHIEGDASSASYFLALGLIGQGPVTVHGVGADSIQGDVQFAEHIRAMGADVVVGETSITVTGTQVAKGQRLRAFDTDFNLVPDAAMTAAVLALYADGPCSLRNIGSWRVKETDRIDAMRNELTKLGAKVQAGDDWLTVWPIEPGHWRDASIRTYDDHRMAMCFSLAAFGGAAVTIEDPDCVSKTFPDYFEVYQTLVC